MARSRELIVHRILTGCAVLAAVAASAIPRSSGPSAQERTAAACACGAACKCAETHAAAPGHATPVRPAQVAEKTAAATRAANEASAIATLRNITSAQAQMQAVGVIDGDADGIGEYAYLGELAGTHPFRIRSGQAYAIGSEKLDPPVLPSSYGNLTGGTIERKGYLIRVFLVNAAGQAVAEHATGGPDRARMPDPERCEIVWCAYAWPLQRGETGDRAFFVNQGGDVLECGNAKRGYSGAASAPAADAAFAKGGKAGSIDQPLAAAKSDKTGMDGDVWSPVD